KLLFVVIRLERSNGKDGLQYHRNYRSQHSSDRAKNHDTDDGRQECIKWTNPNRFTCDDRLCNLPNYDQHNIQEADLPSQCRISHKKVDERPWNHDNTASQYGNDVYNGNPQSF